MFDLYLKTLINAVKAGNATEHTHRPALQKLIESFGEKLTVTNEPKRIACGAPDFVISQNYQDLGYVEAKDIDVALKKEEKSNQMKRYLGALGNLILTNYLEFRWYVDGELRTSASLGEIDKKGNFKVDSSGQAQVEGLIKGFLVTEAPQAKTPKELAKKMADLAQLIREAIAIKLKDAKDGLLFDQYESFQKVLISGLTRADFADMYAQTICYGLFAARCNTNTPQDFSRKTAAFELPKTNPFLRDIFDKIAGIDLDESIAWAVDILANILKLTDMEAILKDFGKRTRREDPVVHFYETFLAEYDPKMRQSRGVYYTPEPVVSYIVRSVDYILKEKFGIKDGLASKQKIMMADPKDLQKTIESHQVLILDPAVGTGTFLHGVIDHIYETFKHKKGMWSSYVSQHLLPRLFGFELLMAPYTVAHMKLGLQLQELGYEFDSDERLKIYLTNTLQEAFQIPQASGFMTRIKDEAEAAKEVKQERPVMVVLGNPPYSAVSSNTDPWIVNLVKDYYYIDNQKIKEDNAQSLLDDYVKFIRFAQYRVEQTGYGVVAFITNHGFLDNPTFRGMRHNLIKTFDEIYILDLHGNNKRGEKSPDGSLDQNVFDIQQGVSIEFFVKYQQKINQKQKLYRFDLYGIRDNQKEKKGKYYWLNTNSLESTDWEEVKVNKPFFLFQNQNQEILQEYLICPTISDIMLLHSMGIKSNRDALLIDFEKDCLEKRFQDFESDKITDQDISTMYSIEDSRYWNIKRERQKIRNATWKKNIYKYSYRPFDNRWILYQVNLIQIGRGGAGFNVMKHMIDEKNIGLITSRQQSQDNLWSLIWITNLITDNCSISNKTKERTYLFPIYTYPSEQLTLLEAYDRYHNFDEKFILEFVEKLNLEFIADGKGDQNQTFGPEDIFNYIYAVFHSPTYRSRYAEFLKIDFPRVPLTSQPKLFWQLANLGDELVQIHLMNCQLETITGFPVDGDNLIEKITYTEPAKEQNGRVYINKTQYIDNVPLDIYNFYIGGYQVCNKWLKDRKGREFTDDDFEHYSQIIVILKRTMELMNNIDQVIEKYDGFPIE